MAGVLDTLTPYLSPSLAPSHSYHHRTPPQRRDVQESFAHAPVERLVAEGDVDDKRSINYEILKNKGLTPARKKEVRNPRVKHRKKYEKSLVRLKSFKHVVKDTQSAYKGEQTGIKKNLARSVKF